MRIVFISDTHGLHHSMIHPVPDGDVLVHCGDVSNVGALSGIEDFLRWFIQKPHRHKVFIAGNHDWGFQTKKEQVNSLFASIKQRYYPMGFTYLLESSTIIKGIKFYGAPQQPEFCDWAFNVPRGTALKKIWSKIPDDTDVLITHGPPHKILDKVVYGGENVGCVDLLDRIEEINPAIHAFGHIHETYGTKEVGRTIYINASVCNLQYNPINRPIVVDINEETKNVRMVQER